MQDRCMNCGKELFRLPHGATERCCNGAYSTVLVPTPRDQVVARDLGSMWAWYPLAGCPHYVFGPPDWPRWGTAPGHRLAI